MTFLDRKANICVFICLHNAYIIQVPGDFLGGVQNSLLLTQVPTFTCQYVNDTPQHRYTSIWDLRQDLLKMRPYMPAVKWLGRHTKANANSGLWFGRWLGTKLLKMQVTKTKQQLLMKEDGTDPRSRKLSLLQGPSIIAAASWACGSSQAPATPSSSCRLVAKAIMPINKGHINSSVGTNNRQKQADMIQSA